MNLFGNILILPSFLSDSYARYSIVGCHIFFPPALHIPYFRVFWLSLFLLEVHLNCIMKSLTYEVFFSLSTLKILSSSFNRLTTTCLSEVFLCLSQYRFIEILRSESQYFLNSLPSFQPVFSTVFFLTLSIYLHHFRPYLYIC